MQNRWNAVDYGLRDKRTPPDFRCIECGAVPRLTDGAEIYPHRPDLHAKKFYVCDSCRGSYCGCHPDTTTPLGYPCGPQTRKARMAAHDVIDAIWRNKIATRKEVYRNLAARLGIPHHECHVAWMNADEARHAAKVGEQMAADMRSGTR